MRLDFALLNMVLPATSEHMFGNCVRLKQRTLCGEHNSVWRTQTHTHTHTRKHTLSHAFKLWCSGVVDSNGRTAFDNRPFFVCVCRVVCVLRARWQLAKIAVLKPAAHSARLAQQRDAVGAKGWNTNGGVCWCSSVNVLNEHVLLQFEFGCPACWAMGQ